MAGIYVLWKDEGDWIEKHVACDGQCEVEEGQG